ncbi:glutatione regulated potassium efflux transport protein [Rhodococcus opacus]|uniref:Glutatione regulated potassium efflux transport protein n=1 Tax=Rhodococcus opacus TaxID=37919 RepID=A0A1B1JXU6_RHOOP|nr:cation:proton antiporter [Rhodococcus opacus]ANS25174.1 glutatione regulated potassium efflux transport protein [Rhodococcus opacus]
MPSVGASLFWIVACAVIAPLLAGLFPRKLVPEVVLLLVAGIVIGPHVFDLAVEGSEIELLRDLGLGLLFLLAGYEIDTAEITGRGGRRALLTWLVSLALAFAVVTLLSLVHVVDAGTAVAIAMTSTALGTLLPIFFVTSGMAIDVAAVASEPGVLIAFVLLILLVRAGPVYFAGRFDRGADGTDPPFTGRERTQLALYAGTGLPLIVAVTGVAVDSGDMTSANASVLVAAGAITVLLFPLAASLPASGPEPSADTASPRGDQNPGSRQ